MAKLFINEKNRKGHINPEIYGHFSEHLGRCIYEGLERIRRFEEQHNALVYVVIRSYTTIGKMDCYLFVNDHVEEWERDRKSLEAPGDGVFSYVYNFDDPDCSEFGDIGVAKTPAAGLRRTC